MTEHLEVAARVEGLVEQIDPVVPGVDWERASERLLAYSHALGIETAPEVRWLPNPLALREARAARWGYWGSWPSFTARQAWLFRSGSQHDRRGSVSARAESLARIDAVVLAAGLGSAHCVDGVCRLVPELIWRVHELTGEPPVLVPKRVTALVPLAEAAAAGLYAFAALDPGLLGCVSRPLLRLDEEDRLHDWDGRPAVDWQEGSGLWYWHGVQMSESAGRKPERVTPRRIAGWANSERRRVAIERIGLEAFLRGLGAEIVQQDDYGRLWRTRQEVDGEAYVAVEVTNATPEADGSYRRYFLRVPPSTRTARAAVAWSFGIGARDYMPLVQT
jgi:Domain of unknown function (DUF6745)